MPEETKIKAVAIPDKEIKPETTDTKSGTTKTLGELLLEEGDAEIPEPEKRVDGIFTGINCPVEQDPWHEVGPDRDVSKVCLDVRNNSETIQRKVIWSSSGQEARKAREPVKCYIQFCVCQGLLKGRECYTEYDLSLGPQRFFR